MDASTQNAEIRRARVTAVPQRPEGQIGRKCDGATVHRTNRAKQVGSSVTWAVGVLNRDLKNFGCGLAKQSLDRPLISVTLITTRCLDFRSSCRAGEAALGSGPALKILGPLRDPTQASPAATKKRGDLVAAAEGCVRLRSRRYSRRLSFCLGNLGPLRDPTQASPAATEISGAQFVAAAEGCVGLRSRRCFGRLGFCLGNLGPLRDPTQAAPAATKKRGDLVAAAEGCVRLRSRRYLRRLGFCLGNLGPLRDPTQAAPAATKKRGDLVAAAEGCVRLRSRRYSRRLSFCLGNLGPLRDPTQASPAATGLCI